MKINSYIATILMFFTILYMVAFIVKGEDVYFVMTNIFAAAGLLSCRGKE